jgi:hypothetical protein
VGALTNAFAGAVPLTYCGVGKNRRCGFEVVDVRPHLCNPLIVTQQARSNGEARPR